MDLTNSEYRVIGQLWGGESGCPPVLQRYGRLTESWEGGGTDDTRLDIWLNSFNNFKWQTNTIGLGQLFNLWDITINRDERIICKEVNLKNVIVQSGKTLKIEATEKIIINSGVIVKSGGTLILDGHTSINALYTVESGASFIVK